MLAPNKLLYSIGGTQVYRGPIPTSHPFINTAISLYSHNDSQSKLGLHSPVAKSLEAAQGSCYEIKIVTPAHIP